jgi:hypothetical protein
MSSCIFSGSRKGNGKRTVGTLGKPGFKAGRCREAVGIKKRAWSSSRSSVGVLNVEDAGRVTQGQRVEEMTMTSLISLAVAFLNFLHAHPEVEEFSMQAKREDSLDTGVGRS